MQKFMLPKIIGFCGVLVLIGLGLNQIVSPKPATNGAATSKIRPNGSASEQSELSEYISRTAYTMSTSFYFRAVAPTKLNIDIEKLMDNALKSMEAVTLGMNIYSPTSEISKFNRSEPNKKFKLSPKTFEVLKYSHEIYKQSDGTFDVTAKPLIKIWKNLQPKREIKDPVTQQVMQTIGGLPTKAELLKARKESQWSDIKIFDQGAMRLNKTVSVDLGGVAKGYSIDLATEYLKKAGCVGALVNVGGDIRCFGTHPNGQKWRVSIRNPFAEDPNIPLKVIKISDGAVCTSGNYERRRIIDGVSYSHIVDPRTMRPADLYPSVTVIAPTTMIADAWATALSVLGPDGFKLIEPLGIEAMIVVGTKDKHEVKMTKRFHKYIDEKLTNSLKKK